MFSHSRSSAAAAAFLLAAASAAAHEPGSYGADSDAVSQPGRPYAERTTSQQDTATQAVVCGPEGEVIVGDADGIDDTDGVTVTTGRDGSTATTSVSRSGGGVSSSVTIGGNSASSVAGSASAGGSGVSVTTSAGGGEAQTVVRCR